MHLLQLTEGELPVYLNTCYWGAYMDFIIFFLAQRKHLALHREQKTSTVG